MLCLLCLWDDHIFIWLFCYLIFIPYKMLVNWSERNICMQLNVEPVSTKHYIILFKIAALVELLFKVVDEKIVSNILILLLKVLPLIMMTYFALAFVHFDVFAIWTILFDYLLFYLNLEFVRVCWFCLWFGSLFYQWQTSYPIAICMLFACDLFWTIVKNEIYKWSLILEVVNFPITPKVYNIWITVEFCVGFLGFCEL